MDSTNSSSIFLDPPLQPPLVGGALVGGAASVGGDATTAPGFTNGWWIAAVIFIIFVVFLGGFALYSTMAPPTVPKASTPVPPTPVESCSAAKKKDYKRPVASPRGSGAAVSLANKAASPPRSSPQPTGRLSDKLYDHLSDGMKKVLDEPWKDSSRPIDVCEEQMQNSVTKGIPELAETVIPTGARGALMLANAALNGRHGTNSNNRNLYQAKQAIEGMSTTKGFTPLPAFRRPTLPKQLFSYNPEVEAKTMAARKRVMKQNGAFLNAVAGISSLSGGDHDLANNLALESTNQGVEGYEPELKDFALLYPKAPSNEKTVQLARQAQPPKKLVPGNSWSPRLD